MKEKKTAKEKKLQQKHVDRRGGDGGLNHHWLGHWRTDKKRTLERAETDQLAGSTAVTTTLSTRPASSYIRRERTLTYAYKRKQATQQSI